MTKEQFVKALNKVLENYYNDRHQWGLETLLINIINEVDIIE